MMFALLLLSLLLTSPSWAAAISQVTVGAVTSSPSPSSGVCSGALTYTLAETITAPSLGVIRTVSAAPGALNLAHYIHQSNNNTYLSLTTQVPFAELGTTIVLSTNASPIQAAENAIVSTVDTDGTIYVAYRVLPAVCGSPSTNCVGMMKIRGSTILLTNNSVVQRANSVFGITQDTNNLYVRQQGDGTIGNDTVPVIMKVDKSTLTALGTIQLVAAVESGQDSAPYFDSTTNRIFATTGNGTGNVHIINASTFTLTTTTALGIGLGANTRVTYDSTGGFIYVVETNTPSLRQLNGTTGAFIASVGVPAGGTAIPLIDSNNFSIHYLGTNAATGLTRYSIPTPVAQNTFDTTNWDLGSGNVNLNRLFQIAVAPSNQVRAIKTC